MSKIKNYLSSMFRTFMLMFPDFCYVRKELGSNSYWVHPKKKIQASLMMHCHIIEKGLSLKDVRPGFGQPKVLGIINEMNTFISQYYEGHEVDRQFCCFILSNLRSYIQYQQECDIDIAEISSSYLYLCNLLQINDAELDAYPCGVKHFSKEDYCKEQNGDFETFFKSRHSIREFSDTPVDKDLVNRALEIAEHTPSACNRQPWSVRVLYNAELIDKVLTWQKGSRQFKHMVKCVVVISSSANFFFGEEYHQPYVNGGMYSMSLILALHSQGLGTIPLNVVYDTARLKEIRSLCQLDSSEIPISIIAVGNLNDEFKVALSFRIPYQTYTKTFF